MTTVRLALFVLLVALDVAGALYLTFGGYRALNQRVIKYVERRFQVTVRFRWRYFEVVGARSIGGAFGINLLLMMMLLLATIGPIALLGFINWAASHLLMSGRRH